MIISFDTEYLRDIFENYNYLNDIFDVEISNKYLFLYNSLEEVDNLHDLQMITNMTNCNNYFIISLDDSSIKFTAIGSDLIDLKKINRIKIIKIN